MTDNLKILILEDNLYDADLIICELKKSSFIFSSEVVQTRKTYEKALDRFKPDIILSDYSLPSFDGFSAFHIKQSKYPDIPFIIISGIIGEENAVNLIKIGVTDYALKSKLFTLIPKITRALEETNAKQEKIRAEEERFRLSSILEATSDFVGIADANQRIVYFNGAGRKRMGYGLKEDLSQTKITDYSPAWANEIILNEGLAIALKAGKWIGETAFITKEGEEIPISQVIIAHKNTNGELMFLSTICRDITFQKEMTEKLKIQNKKLYEIAFLQSHQVRVPISNILGLISLFNYDNPNDPINTVVIENLKKTTVAFDEIIYEIVQKTSEIEETQ